MTILLRASVKERSELHSRTHSIFLDEIFATWVWLTRWRPQQEGHNFLPENFPRMAPHSTLQTSTLSLAFHRQHVEDKVVACPQHKMPLGVNLEHVSRRVSFNETIKAQRIHRLDSLSSEDRESYWYTQEDFRAIRRDAAFVAEMVDSGFLVDDKVYHCSRGVESYAKRTSDRRKISTKASRMLVLEEQSRQQSEGYCDPEAIAVACEEISASSAAQARAVGLRDELEFA